ncbi:ABC transporter substrate-binding protein [Sutcliffiella horikoshii]|uniref:ABC transporter substrate-binding protein n=2 Tax=Sutcliffiella horikoshii TaxID=79883 RepID=A0A5D4SXU4_9BACI|nr:ABC transporter substrate-binding protein [Sutcliffiella horikoshii]
MRKQLFHKKRGGKRMKKLGSILLTVILVFSYIVLPMSKVNAEEAATLKIGWTAEADSLSPFLAWTISATEIFKLIYDPLVAFDNNVEPVGRLAKDWQVSDDNLTWTFNLQEGVKWHDGTPFTSADVKFTYETLQESGLGLYAGYLDGITSIETPDELTVVIKTEEPKANMLQSTTPILPKHIWEGISMADLETWPNQNPIGTGAFKFSEFKKDEYIKLEKNPDYFYKPANVDSLVFVLYANTDTLTQSLKIGEIDAAINIGANQVKVLDAEESMEVVSATTHGFTELSINTWPDDNSKGNPLLREKDIRHAMSYAIDKQKIIDVAYAGQATPGSTLIPPSLDFWHYNPENLRSFDPEKAKEILDNAGFTDEDGDGIREADGEPLEFELMVRSKTSEEVRAGEMISSMLEDVGIGVKLETVDDGLLGDRIYDNADFDMFIWGWGTDADPTTILNVMSSEEIGNLSDSYYANEAYDKLLEKQETIIDKEERQKVVHEMQEMLYEDAPYIILLYDNALQAVNTDKWEGWTKVAGVYFYSFNHENYLNVKLASAGEEVADTEDGTVATASDTNENAEASGNAGAIIAVVMVAAVIMTGMFLVKRKKKDVSIDDDM